MRIDSTHRPWMFGTLAALVFLTASFVALNGSVRQVGRGGTVSGLAYGIAGYGLMLFAALLGMRKKVPVWRIGRAQTWMRGHIWLGSLTLPLILFHCAFSWRGPLASLLMVLLFITVGSGILGAALQHYIPEFLTRTVPLETIYEEIPHVRRQLCEEADTIAASISGTAETERTLQTEIDPEIRAQFDAVYVQNIRPVLAASNKDRAPNLTRHFDTLREILPVGVHGLIASLEAICEEDRQLKTQRSIYWWLHGWLLVHVPLSIALLVLGAVHAVVALRY